ncbi:DUF2625 family protein [Campylobacter concisus]|nr:DUF2625 family protein [Campylobacter concisus]
MSSYLLVANDILGKIFTLNGVDFGGKKKGQRLLLCAR